MDIKNPGEERRKEIQREIVELESALGPGLRSGSELGSALSLELRLKLKEKLYPNLNPNLNLATSTLTPTPIQTRTQIANSKTNLNANERRHHLEQSIEDLHNLERFYKDKEYRKMLVSSKYPSREYFEHNDILQQESKVKQELNLPQNSTINYQKVKCSKDCKHNTPPHQYYYAYIWDSNSRKSKKKYIGKQLPLPSF